MIFTKRVFSFLAFALALTGCEDKVSYKVVRTASSPAVYMQGANIQLYRQECTEQQVYGPDSRCGFDVREVCERPAPGMDPVCMDRMVDRSCQHTETSCSKVPDRVVHGEFQVEFDPAAQLNGNEQETYTFDAYMHKDGYFVVSSNGIQSKYRYVKPAAISFYPGQLGSMRFQLSR